MDLHESMALTNDWTPLPFASCIDADAPYNTFAFDHYVVCTVAGSTPLSAPSAGSCLSVSGQSTAHWFEGGTGYGGAFFRAMRETMEDEADCFVNGQGIVFAELAN